jgi:hypothetical protein
MATYDWLDLHIAFAVCADELGLEDGNDAVGRDEQLDGTWYRFSPEGCDALDEVARDDHDGIGWLGIVTVPLVEELCERVGEAWRNEAVVAAELEIAERAERLGELAAAARTGPVLFELDGELVDLVVDRVLSAELADLV